MYSLDLKQRNDGRVAFLLGPSLRLPVSGTWCAFLIAAIQTSRGLWHELDPLPTCLCSLHGLTTSWSSHYLDCTLWCLRARKAANVPIFFKARWRSCLLWGNGCCRNLQNHLHGWDCRDYPTGNECVRACLYKNTCWSKLEHDILLVAVAWWSKTLFSSFVLYAVKKNSLFVLGMSLEVGIFIFFPNASPRCCSATKQQLRRDFTMSLFLPIAWLAIALSI